MGAVVSTSDARFCNSRHAAASHGDAE